MYRSAISTMHEESVYGHLPNPAQNPVVTRFMRGLVREKRIELGIGRTALTSEKAIEITPRILLEIEPHALHGMTARDMPTRAAACMGTFGMLRPNEFLGSPAHPERRLRAAQIAFFAPGSDIPLMLTRPEENEGSVPEYFTIALGATKADQLANNQPHIVAARPAVEALWTWTHKRAEIDRARVHCGRPSDPFLFNHPGGAPMELSTIVKFLQDWLEAMGHGRPLIAGKSFRRGGASGMVESGAARPEIAAAGRWRSAAMIDTYANAAAQRRSMITASAALGRP
jgi:hypothetical protein